MVHSTRVIAQRPPPSSIITRECRVTPDPCSYQVLAPVSRLHLQPLASISKSNIDIAISPQLATLLTLHFVVRPLAGQICPRHVVVSLALSAHSSSNLIQISIWFGIVLSSILSPCLREVFNYNMKTNPFIYGVQ